MKTTKAKAKTKTFKPSVIGGEQLRLNRQFLFEFSYAAGRMALGVANEMKVVEELFFDMTCDHINVASKKGGPVDSTLVQFQFRVHRMKDNDGNDIVKHFTPEQFEEYAGAVAKRRFAYVNNINKKMIDLIFLGDNTSEDAGEQIEFNFPEEAAFRMGITLVARDAVTFLLTGKMPGGVRPPTPPKA